MTVWKLPSPRCRSSPRFGLVMSSLATLRASSLRPLLAPASSAPRSTLSWILLNLAVAVAYSIAGLVVVLFGIGPAKISPVYPPAGIAVAATLILGPRILPAVFIGQFLNGFPLLEQPQTTVAMYLLANTGTGIGSILEALIAVSCCGVSAAHGTRSTGHRMS